MTDDKKKPEDTTPKAQTEESGPTDEVSDAELGDAAGAGDGEYTDGLSKTIP